MLLVLSALKGYAIEASDGRIGTVSDFLFEDETWTVRWLVVDTGNWLSGRKVLVHPSAIGQADYERHELPVALTKAQVEGSPSILRDQPVSQQIEAHLYDYYGWDPLWGSSYFGGIASPLVASPYFGAAAAREAPAPRVARMTEIRICAASLQSPVIISMPPTARSAMSRISLSEVGVGTFATSSSTPGTGGPENMSWCPPTRCGRSAGRITESSST